MRFSLAAIVVTTLVGSSPAAQAQFDPESYANSFSLAGVTDGEVLTLGKPLKLQLVSPQSLERTEVIYGNVKLDLVLRHLQLDEDNGSVLGPYPLPKDNPLDPQTAANAVEAWVGELKGSLPVGFRHIVENATVEVRWHFTDKDGNPLVERKDVQITQLGSPLEVSVLLAPFFTTWTKSPTSTLEQAIAGRASTKQIQAEVRVVVPGATPTNWVPVPAEPVKVQLPQMPVPDVVLGFSAENFGSNAICLVPNTSPVEEPNDLIEVLGTLHSTVDALEVFAQFTALGSVISTLLSNLDDANLAFEKRQVMFHLDDAVMVKQSAAGICDICNPDEQWDDRLSSLVMISDSKEVDFFEDEETEGHRLTVDPSGRNVAVRILSLHSFFPVSNPPGAISFSDNTPDLNWGNKIDSYRWDDQ